MSVRTARALGRAFRYFDVYEEERRFGDTFYVLAYDVQCSRLQDAPIPPCPRPAQGGCFDWLQS
jgi:hypothetical protein